MISRFFSDSWEILKSKYTILPIGMLAEIIFFIAWGFISSPFIVSMEMNLVYLGDELVSSGTTQLTDIIFSSSNTNQFAVLGLILLVISYLMYGLFQGFIWKFSFFMGDGKRNFVRYVKKFFLINLFWLPLFVIYFISNFIFSYADALSRKLDVDGVFFLDNLSVLFLAGIAYFGFISYVLIDKHGIFYSFKKSFRIGLSLRVLTVFVVLALILFAVNFAMAFLGTYFTLILGIVVVMPLMIFSRLVIQKAVISFKNG